MSPPCLSHKVLLSVKMQQLKSILSMHPCFQRWNSSALLLYIICLSLNLDWLRLNERSMWWVTAPVGLDVFLHNFLNLLLQVFHLIWAAGILTDASPLLLYCISSSMLLVALPCCPFFVSQFFFSIKTHHHHHHHHHTTYCSCFPHTPHSCSKSPN